MKKLTMSILVICCLAMPGFAVAQDSSADGMLLPPAEPGECYARVFAPPTYRTDSEQVLKSEASERVEIVPATYETVQERVLVREASERLEIVPATYETVEERVLVRPATQRLVDVPATYETKSEKVLETPAHVVWKRGRGLIETVDNATGEILCRVEVPATYKTVTKRILKSPATVKEVDVPAQYKTIAKRVVKTPATTRKVEIPAQYDTVPVTKLVRPSDVRKIEIPAEYQTVTRRVMVTEGGLEWRRVLCETNMTASRIQDIQRALKSAGYDPGRVDGVIGSETLSAVRAYQSAKGLAVGGLTYETLDSLGI